MSTELVKDSIQLFLKQYNHGQIFIGLSGGIDSIVLTHALASLIEQKTNLRAVYIHHGLQPEADEWEVFCRAFCNEIAVHFQSVHVNIGSTNRKGIEAAAREARYQTFYQLMEGGDCLVTAHHLQDQVETVLLNLFRGSGVSGLSAMPFEKEVMIENKYIVHSRPFLNLSKKTIELYARENGLQWVDDPSNNDIAYQRNYLRHQVLPSIYKGWSKADENIVKFSHHLTEAQKLFEEFAESDSDLCQMTSFSLDLSQVSKMSWSRQKNLLMFWAKKHLQSFRFTQEIFEWVKGALENNNPEAHPIRKTRLGEIRVEGSKIYFFADFKEEFSVLFCDDLEWLYFDENHLLTHDISDKFFTSDNKVMLRTLTKTEKEEFPQLKKWLKQNHVVWWNRPRWPVIEVNGELAAILGFKTFSKFK